MAEKKTTAETKPAAKKKAPAKKAAAKATTLRITQVKSIIGTPQDQKATVRALGLKRINDTVEQADTPVIRGMVFKVKHLVSVVEA